MVLEAHDINAVLDVTPRLSITSSTTGEEANAAVGMLTKLDECSLGVMRFSGLTPWERHPGGDELLHALEGDVEVTTLTDDGPVQTALRAGYVFVCPRGLWHRQLARREVTMFFATPIEMSEHSFAEDPRAGA